jgi:hypothetical protein
MIIIDDFITDQQLLRKMADSEGDFWRTGYHWWSGWWNDTGPMTVRHELIEQIWRHKCPEQMWGLNMGGFEHWTGVLSKDNTIGDEKGYALNHHHDKDEGGGMDKPIIGTVYYPPMGGLQCEGGYLKIYSHNDRSAPYDLIAPVPNRLVIFDATQLHAVTEIPEGNRYAVAINLWDEKPTTEMIEEI